MERDMVATRLRELRLAAGISQQNLGARLRRPQSYVSKIENAERRVEFHEIEEWATATGYELRWSFVGRGAEPEVGGERAGTDAELLSTVTALLPRLDGPDRALLQSTVSYLLERIEGEGR